MKNILKKKRFYIIIVCLYLFLLIAILVLKKGILDIDSHSYSFIKNNLMSESLTPFIKIITNLGSAIVLIIVTLLITLFIKNKKTSIAIIINLVLAVLLNLIAKEIFARARPINSLRLVDEIGYSFPSGHSAVSMAFYGFLIYLIYNKYTKKSKWILISFLSIIIIFIGISRIYLGVHYLSDVLAGFLFSISYLIIFVYFYNKIIKKL